MAPTLKDMQIT